MWPYPKIVAHRGGGSLAPENTLAAMRCGLAHGFHAVEFDVMLSKDGIPVLMHDVQLGRTVQGSGSIFNYAAHALTTMDAGSWFGAEFAGEPIPAYEQVLHFCTANRIWMNVEIKPAPGHEIITGQTVGLLTQRLLAAQFDAGVVDIGNAGLPLFSSFSFAALLAAKDAAPAIPRGYLVDIIPPDWQTRLVELEAVALHTNQRNLTAAQAHAVKEAGYGLFCYTVNDTARATEILSWGVDGFCTDRIDLINADFA